MMILFCVSLWKTRLSYANLQHIKLSSTYISTNDKSNEKGHTYFLIFSTSLLIFGKKVAAILIKIYLILHDNTHIYPDKGL